MSKYQIVFWKKWIGLGNAGPYPIDGSAKGMVYKWRFKLFFIEIRRWSDYLGDVVDVGGNGPPSP